MSLWNSLPPDVGVLSGLDAFQRGMNRLMEKSRGCHDGYVQPPAFRSRWSLKVRCKDAGLVVL